MVKMLTVRKVWMVGLIPDIGTNIILYNIGTNSILYNIVSLKIWGLLLKERICFPWEAPYEEGDGLRLSHEKVYLFAS